MRFQKLSLVILSAIAMVATGVAQGAAPKAKPIVLKEVQSFIVGKIPKANLKGTEKITKGSMVGDTASLTKLWKLWKLDLKKQPKIDFHKHAVCVYTVDTGRYRSTMSPSLFIDSQGILNVGFPSDRRGFTATGISRIKLVLIERAGITQVNVLKQNAAGKYIHVPVKISVEPKKK